MQVLEGLQQEGYGNWWLTPAGSIVTQSREFRTLTKLSQIPLLDYILNPNKSGGWGSGVEEGQLHPAADAELPAEVRSSKFKSYLNDNFDQPQIHAITCAAAHLARQQQQQQRVSTDDADLMEIDQQQQQQDDEQYVPFTLIQGPPGTGKTHTVLGVLNTWHLTQFQRFFMSLDAAVRTLAESVRKTGLQLGGCGKGL